MNYCARPLSILWIRSPQCTGSPDQRRSISPALKMHHAACSLRFLLAPVRGSPPPPFAACCPPGSALRASLIDRGRQNEVSFTFPGAARVRVYVGPASRRCAMPLSLHLNLFIVFLPRPFSSPSIASCSFPCGCPCPTDLINLTRLLFDCDAFSEPHECLLYASSVCSSCGSLCCRQSRKDTNEAESPGIYVSQALRVAAAAAGQRARGGADCERGA